MAGVLGSAAAAVSLPWDEAGFLVLDMANYRKAFN